MTATVVQKTVYGLAAIGAILLLAICAMGFLAYRAAEASHWTAHTHQVIEELLYSLSSLQDVETGARGYVATGDKTFLEPYNWGKAAVAKHLDQVAAFTTDNPEEQKRVSEARRLSNEKTQFEVKVTAAAVEKGRALVAAGNGKVIMDDYRKQIALMIDSERNLLAARNKELEQAQLSLWSVTAVLALSAIGLLTWVFKITRSAIEDEKRRVSELNILNVGLQKEVEQRKKTEKALKETTLKLVSSNTDLQQFAYVASHDLQEPLRAVAGFLTLIASKETGKLDEETAGWINHAVEGSQRMRTLINDLLAYARVESRGKDLTEIDSNKALAQAKKDLSVVLQETEAQVTSSQLPLVLGEEGQLAQLFQNLIGNALKFKGSIKPTVNIEANQKNSDWIFSVKDNGIGFDQEHAERIFVIFQRLQGRDEYKGTGIGLALCKKIVERHGGRIWAESAKGKGSTFFLLSQYCKEKTMADPRPIRILMAEDSPSDAELAKQAFKDGKLLNELTIVKDGEECIAYLKKKGQFANAGRPDILLLDLNMPKKSGLEVLEEIKKDADLMTIPVIVLTTSESEQDIVRSYQLQASSFITKPVDFANFLEVARQIRQFYFHVVTLPPNGDK